MRRPFARRAVRKFMPGEELSDALTATVEIRVKKRGRGGEQGEVAIAFGSLDELNGLLEKLGHSRS